MDFGIRKFVNVFGIHRLGLKILPDGMSILVDHNGKALGDAFVQFATYHDAKLAKERNGNKIAHRFEWQWIPLSNYK